MLHPKLRNELPDSQMANDVNALRSINRHSNTFHNNRFKNPKANIILADPLFRFSRVKLLLSPRCSSHPCVPEPTEPKCSNWRVEP